MRLTLHSDYGLRVLLFLATRPGDTVSIGEVAAGYGISAHHLGKVARRLGREGYVELLRGAKGGLRSRAPPRLDGHTLADAVGRPGALVRLLRRKRGVVPGRAGAPPAAAGGSTVRLRAS
jgi:Rrf2 family nitric oxide-sensitive transcriptional repressor